MDATEESSSTTSEKKEEESPEWTILFAMRSAGLKFQESLDFNEETKLFTFTLNMESLGSKSRPFTFVASSPEQKGVAGDDYIPSCCAEVAKMAVKWFSELRILLINFNQRKICISLMFLFIIFFNSSLGWRSFVVDVSIFVD